MRRLLDIAETGLAAVLLHPLRSLVCIAAVLAVLVPYLVGSALSEGIEAEAEASARFGADLYLTGSRFGRPAPVPLTVLDAVGRIDGVQSAVPRIVGEVNLGKEGIPAVLVGLPAEDFPRWAACIRGRAPRPGSVNELVLGTTLARRLHLEVGSVLPPFYRNDRQGERLSRVVGIFEPDAPLWQAHLILTPFETAAAVFDQPGLATDVLVWCRPGYQEAVSRAIELEPPRTVRGGTDPVRLRVTAREDLLALLPQGPLHRQGIFSLHFLLAFTIGILVLLVTSGLGLTERRREIGILKATGWQTDEVLLRSLAESLTLSLIGACLALLLAWVWLRLFNGFAVAGFFLDGVETRPDFPIPFRLTPVPALLGFVFALVLVLTGTVFSAWRAATAPPRMAMR
jgi:ABC-type lipoprotein release transport system permease subunit